MYKNICQYLSRLQHFGHYGRLPCTSVLQKNRNAEIFKMWFADNYDHVWRQIYLIDQNCLQILFCSGILGFITPGVLQVCCTLKCPRNLFLPDTFLPLKVPDREERLCALCWVGSGWRIWRSLAPEPGRTGRGAGWRRRHRAGSTAPT